MARMSEPLPHPAFSTGESRFAGRFDIVRTLHAGVRAQVLLIREQSSGDLLVVKVARGTSDAATLRRQYDLLRACAGNGVLAVREFDSSAGLAWYSMEYAGNGDLSRWRGQRFDRWLTTVIEVAQVLARLHGENVLHGDLKLGNVLIAADGSVRLNDIVLGDPAARAEPASWEGSPYSLSPERRAGREPTASDDVYAFGVMLYELLTGYPPRYPDAPGANVPPLQPQFPAPDALINLTHTCLNQVSMERPGDMDIIVATLRAIARQSLNSNVAPVAMSIPLKPPDLSPPRSNVPLRSDWQRTANEARGRSSGPLGRRAVTITSTLLLMAGVIYVTVILPRSVPHAVAPPAVYKPAGVETPAAEPMKPVDLARLADQKQRAEDQRAALDPRIDSLKGRGAFLWADDDWNALQSSLAAGDAQVANREFAKALQTYAGVEKAVADLEHRAGGVLKEKLLAGEQALEAGKAQAASDAFDIALKLDPKNAAAERGRKRAQSLDQVFALVTQGAQFEQQGDNAHAAEAYRQALALDPLTTRAKDGLQRAQSRISNDAFGAAMAKGYAALSRKEYAHARAGFAAAGQLRANAPEVAQALKQVEQEERSAAILKILQGAPALEVGEKWSEALSAYREALQLDPTVVAAQEGVARVEPRAKLNAELELYLTQPERLFGNAVRANARATLQRATAIQPAGPVLKQQLAKLNEWLTRAETPIEIALQSDGLTAVTIYRVGDLGTFERRAVTLAPGQYTAVGRRPGYRDVRRQFDVVPGQAVALIDIRCEEKI